MVTLVAFVELIIQLAALELIGNNIAKVMDWTKHQDIGQCLILALSHDIRYFGASYKWMGTCTFVENINNY